MYVAVTEQTYANYKLIMYYFRFTGLFPVRVRKASSKVFLQFSPLYVILWWIFAGFAIFMAYWGVILDTQSKDISNRLEADTDKLMFLLQVTEYSAVFFIGAFINPCRFRRLFDYIQCINKVDSIIKTTYKKCDKFKLLIIPTIIIIYNATYSWIYLNAVYEMFQDALSLFEILKRYMAVSIVAYFAWVCEYMDMVMLGSLEKRIQRLNYLLAHEYDKVAGRNRTQRDDTTIVKLTRAYMTTMDAAGILIDFISLSLLVTTAAVFWALIYALYFFMVDMGLDRGDIDNIGELYLILMQLCAHTCRALLIINPAYSCLIQINNTKALVCKLLSCDLTPQYRKQLKTFAVILGLRQLEFSACGFLVVDRLLFTSLVDTITTILMVLYQYRSDIQIDF